LHHLSAAGKGKERLVLCLLCNKSLFDDRRIKVADNLTVEVVDNGHGHTEDITGSGLTNLASTRTRMSVGASPSSAFPSAARCCGWSASLP